MTVEERKEKEQELYGLMEMDVMRNSDEIRTLLGNELGSRTQLEDGVGKQIVDLLYPKIMTYQDIPEDRMTQMAQSPEIVEKHIDISKIIQGIELIKEYQRGDIDISKISKGQDIVTEDNEK